MKFFFYSFYSDRILNPKYHIKGIGGAEVQMAFWSKTLAAKEKVYTFGASLHSFPFRKEGGIYYFFSPLVPGITKIVSYLRPFVLLLHRPDYVVLRGPVSEFFILRKIKRIVHFKIIYMLASDSNVKKDFSPYDTFIQHIFSNADYVIAQNDYQYNACINLYKIHHVTKISNIWCKELFQTITKEKQYDYIWVGSIKQIKRPEWLIELAKRNPQKKFAIVGKPSEQYKFILNDFKLIPNIYYLGFLSLYETTKEVSKAKCLINTSEYEGFPNVFLQAFSFEIPVIATVNPNGILTEGNIGFFVETIGELDSLIKQDAYKKINAVDITQYFNENHSPTKGMDCFLDMLKEG